MSKCIDCTGITFNPDGPYVYICPIINKFDTDCYEERECEDFDPRVYPVVISTGDGVGFTMMTEEEIRGLRA